MRKNGINRTLLPIAGGICAPAGFRVSATRVGFCKADKEKEDLALIVTKRRYAAAFFGNDCVNVGAHVKLSEKHMRAGFASAVLINGGVANGCGEIADKLAETISRLFANKCNFDRNEMILISTGRWGESLDIATFERGISALAKGFGNTDEYSLAAARTLSLGGEGNQCSFSFWIGDIECKIGGIYHASAWGKGWAQANTCVLTTDVKISSKMLHKALKSVANEYFYMLGGCIFSPNDSLSILASGEAGNWEITENNSDYQKFVFALSGVMEYISKQCTATNEKVVLYKVKGAKSKNTARKVAKILANSTWVKDTLSAENFDVQNLLSVLLSSDENVNMDSLHICLRALDCEFVVYEEGRQLPLSKNTLTNVFDSEEIEVIIELKKGNYAATAYGNI